MTLVEAESWLAKFNAWFEWNKVILDRKGLETQRILLETFPQRQNGIQIENEQNNHIGNTSQRGRRTD